MELATGIEIRDATGNPPSFVLAALILISARNV
jgi:hypothetical protein